MSGIQEARGEGVTTLIVDELAVDIHDDMPGQAVVHTWFGEKPGDIMSVEDLENLRRLIDETLARLP